MDKKNHVYQMCAPTTFFTVILRHFTVVKCSGAKDQHVSSKALNRCSIYIRYIIYFWMMVLENRPIGLDGQGKISACVTLIRPTPNVRTLLVAWLGY